MWEHFNTENVLFLPSCRSQQVDKFWCLRTQEKVEPRGEMEVERDNCSRSAYSLVFHLRPASDSVNV